MKKIIQTIRTEGWKGFILKWKKGIEATTPLQSTIAQIVFTRITLLGISLGFLVSLWKIKNFWWLGIILLGALGNTYMGLVALKQKKKMLEQFQVNLQEVQ